jgi:PadR family transcriptional regulator PadR
MEIAKELQRYGYSISLGILYPTLHRLENNGLLKSNLKVFDGKMRQYYCITAKGRRLLDDSENEIRELVNGVLEES